MHLLVVDDDPAVREALALVLDLNGFEVTTAGDGRERDRAVAQANSSSPMKPPGSTPGGHAKTELDVCTVKRLSASLAARRRCTGMN